MDRNMILTGQLFFRDTRVDSKELDGSDRRIISTVGVLAVPHSIILKGEHQYVVAGDHVINGKLTMTVHPDGKDLTEYARGMGIAGLLTSPIWRT